MKCILLALSVVVAGAVDLDHALVNDLLPPASDKCLVGGTGRTQHSFIYQSTNHISKWDAMALPFERQMFLADLIHLDPSVNRSWKIRIGSGGGINSFIGPLGETVPPQKHNEAPWIDEVWQLVSVDTGQNTADDPYFIHQAGTYIRDEELNGKPLYSPNIAKHCAGKTCSFISWGQQAHVPTKFTSEALYYTRYTDCGSGVLEVTSGIHNFGDVGTGDEWNYFNIPWGGVRPSVFKQTYYANKGTSGSQKIDVFGWGQTGECPGTCWDLSSFGGYTMFTEGLPLPEDEKVYELPCSDGSQQVACTGVGDTHISLVIAQNNPAQESAGHTTNWGTYTVLLRFESTANIGSAGCQSCKLWFVNQNGDRITCSGIIHWVHAQTRMYFWPEETAAQINAVFKKGDVISVFNVDDGKPANNNLAMTIVHGVDVEGNDNANRAGVDKWVNRAGRVRVGLANAQGRDYMVYTANAFLKLSGQRTYYNRQYMITDRYEDMDVHAREWVSEVESGMYFPGRHNKGRIVKLYGSADGLYFGADLSNLETCGTNICTGSTTPQYGLKPLFYITCGIDTIVSENPYAFAARDVSTQVIRSYRCDGQSANARPTWKLLGFFAPQSCDALINVKYNKNLCVQASNAGPQPESRKAQVQRHQAKTAKINNNIKRFEAKRPTGGYASAPAGSTGTSVSGSAQSGSNGNPPASSSSAGRTQSPLDALIGRLRRRNSDL